MESRPEPVESRPHYDNNNIYPKRGVNYSACEDTGALGKKVEVPDCPKNLVTMSGGTGTGGQLARRSDSARPGVRDGERLEDNKNICLGFRCWQNSFVTAMGKNDEFIGGGARLAVEKFALTSQLVCERWRRESRWQRWRSEAETTHSGAQMLYDGWFLP